jgi:histone acetyltransferase
MHKARYQGLIKDYDGGTIMECYIHPSIDYTRIPEMIHAQKQFILERIRAISKSDKVVMEDHHQQNGGGGGGGYPPLPSDFASRMSSINGGGGAREGTIRASAERALSIPGVIEAGWTMSDILSLLHRNGNSSKDMDRRKSQLKSELLNIVSKVSDQQFAWCFRDPVNTDEVEDYLSVIKEPIDLRTMEKRIRKGDCYKNMSMLYVDMMKMVNNCKMYNPEESMYYDHAVSLEKYLGTIFPKRVVTSTASSSRIADDSGGDVTIGGGS